MTRLMYRRNKPTSLTRVVALVVTVVFLLSFTGAVQAAEPSPETAASQQVTEQPVVEPVAEEPAAPEAVAPDAAASQAPVEPVSQTPVKSDKTPAVEKPKAEAAPEDGGVAEPAQVPVADVPDADSVTTGVIHVYKFNDTNGNGGQDEGEGPLAGFSFCIEGTDEVVITGDDGFAHFAPRALGAYVVREVPREGWEVTTGGYSQEVCLDSASATLCFGNRAAASIRVEKDVVPAAAAPGETVDWTFVITNDGGVPLTGVYLLDPLLELDDSYGPLAPGESIKISVPWFVRAVPYPEIVNEVSVLGVYPLGCVTDTDTAVLDLCGPAVTKVFQLTTASELHPSPDYVEADYVIDGQTTTVRLYDQGAGLWQSGPQVLEWGTIIQSWAVWAVVDGARWPIALDGDNTAEALVPLGDELTVVNRAVYDPASISGVKAIDVDRDGDADEAGTAFADGWTFRLEELGLTTVTDQTGAFRFANLLPGTFTVSEVVSEAQAALYRPISPAEGGRSATVGSGDDAVLAAFVNQPVASGIDVIKSVSPSSAIPGDSVVYSFTVRNTGPWPLNVALTDDMLPAVATTAIPQLAAAGTPGDSFSFTVPFTVPADQPAGTLTNVVTAVGTDQFNQQVSDTATADLVVEPFAPFTPGEETSETSESPFLPFTGGRLALLLFATGFALAAGFSLRKVGGGVR